METKVCKCCGKELPIAEFAVIGIKGMKGERKVTNLCKSCMAEKLQMVATNQSTMQR